MVLGMQKSRFIDRWLNKANSYTENNIEDHFDRFFSLFVAYNAMYNVIEYELKRESSRTKNKGDKDKATKQIRKFLRDQIGLKSLLDKFNPNKIERLSNLIGSTFNIHLYNGQSQRDLDEQLIRKLRSGEVESVSIAILDTLYHVRCNMFHGEKAISNRQRELLSILNDFLLIIIQTTKKCMEDYYY